MANEDYLVLKYVPRLFYQFMREEDFRNIDFYYSKSDKRVIMKFDHPILYEKILNIEEKTYNNESFCKNYCTALGLKDVKEDPFIFKLNRPRSLKEDYLVAIPEFRSGNLVNYFKEEDDDKLEFGYVGYLIPVRIRVDSIGDLDYERTYKKSIYKDIGLYDANGHWIDYGL